MLFSLGKPTMRPLLRAIGLVVILLTAFGVGDPTSASADEMKDEFFPVTQAYQQGDFPRALLLAEAIRKKYEPRVGKDGEEMCFVHLMIAETRRSLGEMAAARTSAEQALKTCGKSNYVANESVASAKLVLALVESDASNDARAEQLTLEAIATFEKSELAGAQMKLPTCYGSLAEIRRRRGNVRGAQEAMARAKELESQTVRGRSPGSSDPEFVRSQQLMIKRDRLTRMNNDALISELSLIHISEPTRPY